MPHCFVLNSWIFSLKGKYLWLLTLLQLEMKKLQRRRQHATTNEGGI
jgi:hypothetical protein